MEIDKVFWPIWRIDSKWKIRERRAGVVPFDKFTTISISTGIKDGKMVSQLTIIKEWKNIGRSNETTPYEQAVSEAQSAYEKQLKKWYAVNIEDTQQWVKWSWCPSPMLAKTYDPEKKQSGSNDLKWYKLEWQTVVVQPKLDGVRRLFIMVIWVTSPWELKSYTRSWDEVPVMEHMKDDIMDFILDNNLCGKYLDWELYCDPSLMSFQELNGLTRKSEGDPERLKLIKYHIYDIISDEWYQERFLCDRSYPWWESIEIIPSNIIDYATKDQIDILMAAFIDRWYEWAMIRTLDTPYENKRSKSLLKYKQFEDSEFLCTGIELDKQWMVGAITVVDWDQTFSPAVVGTDDYKMWLIANADSVVWKMVTVNFFWRSIDWVPRFPRFKWVRYDLK